MKKLLLAITSLAAVLQLSAQYTFSESSGVYVPLSANADTVTDPVNFPTWDDDWFRVGIPFPVNMWGQWYDSLAIESNGEVALYNDWTGVADPWYDANDTVPCIMGFGEFFSASPTGDLTSKGPNLSPILMEVTGAPGTRIVKIEWRNAGFYYDTSSAFTNFVNFQIWIHEITGNIELHYGTSYIDDTSYNGSEGPTIGIATADLTPPWQIFSGIYVIGTDTSETAVPNFYQMTGHPSDSTIYFFSNLATVGIAHIEHSLFAVYPNPASDYCTLQLENPNCSVMITDAGGRMVMPNTAINTTSYKLDVSGYDAGLYFITVTTEHGSSTRTLSVQ